MDELNNVRWIVVPTVGVADFSASPVAGYNALFAKLKLETRELGYSSIYEQFVTMAKNIVTVSPRKFESFAGLFEVTQDFFESIGLYQKSPYTRFLIWHPIKKPVAPRGFEKMTLGTVPMHVLASAIFARLEWVKKKMLLEVIDSVTKKIKYKILLKHDENIEEFCTHLMKWWNIFNFILKEGRPISTSQYIRQILSDIDESEISALADSLSRIPMISSKSVQTRYSSYKGALGGNTGSTSTRSTIGEIRKKMGEVSTVDTVCAGAGTGTGTDKPS
jgi:hypothetical protein